MLKIYELCLMCHHLVYFSLTNEYGEGKMTAESTKRRFISSVWV